MYPTVSLTRMMLGHKADVSKTCLLVVLRLSIFYRRRHRQSACKAMGMHFNMVKMMAWKKE